MAAPLVFNEFLGWIDVVDAQNIPPGTRLINAADLLRYENFLVALRDRINAHETSLLDLAPKVATLITDVDAIEALNVTRGTAITNLQTDLDAAEANITALTRGVIVGSTTRTLTNATKTYVHTGAAATITLPPMATSVGLEFIFKNRGTAQFSIRGTESNKMFGTAVSDTFGLLVGSGTMFVNDGTYWNRIGV